MQFLAGFAAFLDYKYWINTRPVPLGPSLASGFLVFFSWFLGAALVLYMVPRYFRRSDRLKQGIFSRFAKRVASMMRRLPCQMVWRCSWMQALRPENVRSQAIPLSLSSKITRLFSIGSMISMRMGPTLMSVRSSGARREP